MVRDWPILRAPERRPAGDYIPSQMASMTEAFLAGRMQVLLLFGTNLMSSFADANAMAAGLARVGLVVSHDLFMNDTARRFADIVLPSTAWLEELGCKMTNTHLYLMEQALAAPGETRSLTWIIRALADRLGLTDFFPWPTDEAMIDALLDHPATGRATVAALRAQGGIGDYASRMWRIWICASRPLPAKWSFMRTCGGTRYATFTSVYGIARHGAGPGACPGPHADALP